MKHVLVIGADGFIGSHFTEMLLEQGLTEAVKWFLNAENLKKYKSNIYNV